MPCLVRYVFPILFFTFRQPDHCVSILKYKKTSHSRYLVKLIPLRIDVDTVNTKRKSHIGQVYWKTLYCEWVVPPFSLLYNQTQTHILKIVLLSDKAWSSKIRNNIIRDNLHLWVLYLESKYEDLATSQVHHVSPIA